MIVTFMASVIIQISLQYLMYPDNVGVPHLNATHVISLVMKIAIIIIANVNMIDRCDESYEG